MRYDSRRFRWVLLLLFSAALAVRLFRLDWDQYHFFHPDERAVAYAIQRLSFRPLQLNPQFFAYGSFPFYVTKAATSLLGLLDPWYRGYDGTIMTGRAISALWGAATCVLLALFGRRLYEPRVGLLAGFYLAFSVFHLQNSHFATNDIPLTFLVLLALYALSAAAESGSPRSFLLAGASVGLAVATKFSAMPVLLPLGVAVLVRMFREGTLARPLGLGAASFGVALATFALGQPYAILDYRSYVHDILEQSRMVRNAGLFPYTNQYIGTPKYLYELRELVLWGMGPCLGLAAVAGTLVRLGRRIGTGELLLLSWVLPYFVISGSFDVKFPRYLLPIYPFLCLWAAKLVVDLSRARPLLGRLVSLAVSVGTLLYAAAFLSIYTRPHTVVRASEWFYANVPRGSKVLTQHWDEGFPMPLPGRSPSHYTIVPLPYYEPDSPSKIASIARELATADYLVFQTKRLYGAVTRAPEKFPLTNNLFYELFAGDLGYVLVREFASRPGLFGIELPSELADESFSVYDHPKVLVFKNEGRLSAEEIQRKVLHGVPSRPLARRDLLLASPKGESPLSGRETEWVRSSWVALLLWVSFLEVLGLAAYALLRGPLAGRPGLYALGKPVGFLVFSYLPWLFAGIGWLPFTRGSALGAFIVLALAGLRAFLRTRDFPFPRREAWATEILFWSVFAFFLTVRAFNPEIYWGEKPMDFSFLNAMYRTVSLPPPEPWFAGSALHYTYFGYFAVAALGKATTVHPALAFNLAIGSTAALTASGVLGAGTLLARAWPAGVLAAVLAVIAGNLAGLREYLARGVVNFDYYWATSRVIRDTINEFPLWTFLFADLHAHMMVMPFTMAFTGLLFAWTRRAERPSDHVPLLSAPVLLVLLSLSLGAVMMTNGWSTPTYVTLLPWVLFVHWVGHVRAEGVFRRLASFAGRVVLPTATVLAGALVFLRPFYWHYTPPEIHWGWEHVQFARPYDFFTIFGLFLVLVLPSFFVLWSRLLRGEAPRLSRTRALAIGLVASGLLLSLFDLEALASLRIVEARSIRIFAALSALLGVFVALHPRTERAWRLPTALGAFALAVTAGCDVVYVWDRMNTVFKFYLESWFLFALASGAVLRALVRGELGRGAPRALWLAVLGVASVLSLFTTVTDVVGILRTRRVETPRPTLDGTAYLRLKSPEEYAAFEWLNRNVRGIPVIVEAYGPSYQEYTRVSMNTGLPTVLGWDYHVYQRAHPWHEINRRKADIEAVYTSDLEAKVASILDRYKVSLVYVGPLERRTYAGANLRNFRAWKNTLTPVYENPGVTIFAVNGRFAGGVPVTHIEEIAAVGEEAEPEPPGFLQQPRGVAVDAQGFAYVCDFGNNRIQKFDPTLESARAWGGRGELPGEFKDPCGVDLGPDGNVYVADTWNQRIQVFDPEGNYLREFGEGFYGPRGVAVDPGTGQVFVADTGNHRVVRYTPDGRKAGEWGGRGEAPGKFFEPVGIDVSASGEVYVCDNGNARVQVFSREGQFLRSFPVPGWRSEVFSEPNVAVDESRGRVWVTVPLEGEIRAYTPEGKLVATIRGDDVPGARFEKPMGIAVAPDGSLVVTDLEHRVLRVPHATGG
ncbi:MAG: hypothetical protein KatS3mg076_0502 [Candidatus Binatia bacterium]|nr:MAG: hypothetical protein KatS3mg076_0502 [Candidatus Binatia bacterium]